jgi:hypothetical protein
LDRRDLSGQGAGGVDLKRQRTVGDQIIRAVAIGEGLNGRRGGGRSGEGYGDNKESRPRDTSNRGGYPSALRSYRSTTIRHGKHEWVEC